MTEQEKDKPIAPAEKAELTDAQLETAAGGGSGGGAGKVAFEPFTVTRKIDKASPGLF